jgi:hypothetical protein
LSLVKTEHLDFKPDYTHSTRVIYTQAAKAIIKALGTSVLALCYSKEDNAITGLPSWVQDWSLEARRTRFITINNRFKARTNHEFGVNEDGKDTLTVRGIKVDTIKYCTQAYDIVKSVDYSEYAFLRHRAFNLRRLLQELLLHVDNQKHSELPLVLFRCISDALPAANTEKMMLALLSRNPIEVILLQSQPEVTGIQKKTVQSVLRASSSRVV